MRDVHPISSLGILAAFLCVAAPPPAAADQIYWGNESGDRISHANVAGGGGADIPISGVSVDHPEGLAIDSAAGRIYWANWEGTAYSIRYANLDGFGGGILNTSGAPVVDPHGLAIDPALGRVYWVNFPDDAVYYANLDGAGGGKLDTTGAVVEQPVGLTVYPAQDRIYWANFDAPEHEIGYANLDGTGEGGTLDLTGAAVDMPEAIAIDPLTNRVYWGNRHSIGYASADGGNGGKVDTDGLPVDPPEGLALDPFRNTIYWAETDFDIIGFAGLNPGGPFGLVETTGATVDNPAYPVLLQVPRNTAPPTITASQVTGGKMLKLRRGTPVVERHRRALSCSRGSWAPDVLESFLYRAPQSFAYQWLRNDRPIAGATASAYEATEVGDYACRETATNGAGSAAQESAPINISARFKLGRAKVDVKNGTARIPIGYSGAGVVALSGKNVKPRRSRLSEGPGKVLVGALVVKPKGRATAKLRAKGKSRVTARITYTPTDGQPLVRTRSVRLRLAAG